MVASLRLAAVLSIFFTLITNTIAMQLKIKTIQWKEIPKKLTGEIQRLFNEFEQQDSNMNNLAEHSIVKESTGMTFAEVEAYPRGPLYNFVTFKFNTSQKVHDTDGKEKDIKFVIVLVLGRINNTKLNLDIYYLVTGGKMIKYDESGFTKAHEDASQSAIDAINTMGFGPGTVRWHDGVWPDMETRMVGKGKENIKKEIKNQLRLESVSFSVDKMDIKNKGYGSIRGETDTLSTLRVAVYQLTENSGKIKNKAKSFFSNAELFFCVVLDLRAESTKVLYTSKPTFSKSEAFVAAEIFATKNVIWDTDNKAMADFEKTINKNLSILVAKALVRKQILQNQLADYMTNETASFPEKLNHYVDLILTLDKDIIETAVSSNEIPHDLALSILDQAFSEMGKLEESLKLKYLKVNNLLTTTTVNQTLYWFEIHQSNKILQCVARATTKTEQMNEIKLEITDIFEDKEHFSVQPMKNMLENETFTTNQIPLYWHPSQSNSKEVKVIRPKYGKNVVALYNTFGLEYYLPEIRAAMKMAKIKGDMPEHSYAFNSGKFASRINPVHEDAVQSGVYFTAKFSDDRICYIFCLLRVVADRVKFIFPEGSTLYDTREAVIDAMETMLKTAEI